MLPRGDQGSVNLARSIRARFGCLGLKQISRQGGSRMACEVMLVRTIGPVYDRPYSSERRKLNLFSSRANLFTLHWHA